jgi:hypothetical protein
MHPPKIHPLYKKQQGARAGIIGTDPKAVVNYRLTLIPCKARLQVHDRITDSTLVFLRPIKGTFQQPFVGK